MFESISASRLSQSIKFDTTEETMIQIAFNELNQVGPTLFPEHLCNGMIQVINNDEVGLVVENDSKKGFRFKITFKNPESMVEHKCTTDYFKIKEGSGPASSRVIFNQQGKEVANDIFALLEENGMSAESFYPMLMSMEPGQLKNLVESDSLRINIQRTESGKFFLTKKVFGKEFSPLMRSAVFSVAVA
ncbi:MAG: hypothetical protein IJ215_04940 [Clostridia bacterium]|nr:hypothetical protein [Clostridia bacterium]